MRRFPVIEEEQLPTPPLIIGEGWCDKPFTRARSSTSAA
jgi:hypothetical protein